MCPIRCSGCTSQSTTTPTDRSDVAIKNNRSAIDSDTAAIAAIAAVSGKKSKRENT